MSSEGRKVVWSVCVWQRRPTGESHNIPYLPCDTKPWSVEKGAGDGDKNNDGAEEGEGAGEVYTESIWKRATNNGRWTGQDWCFDGDGGGFLLSATGMGIKVVGHAAGPAPRQPK